MPLIKVQVRGLWDHLKNVVGFTGGAPDSPTLDPSVQVVLPVEDLLVYPWMADGNTASQTAGSTTRIVLWTVPADERWRLFHVGVNRVSGDNTINNVEVYNPAGYGVASIYMRPAANLATGVTTKFWDPPHPILLEPGATIQLLPKGDGVAATVFSSEFYAEVTKVLRARTPIGGAA